MKTPPPVTVIMRSKNSAWVIDRALAALFSQAYADFELVVVDSGSTDGTIEIAERYPCRLIRIPAESYYPGAVLNDAIARTSAPLVVFQNSDVVPLDPAALGALLAPFEQPEVLAAFARQLPRPEADTWVRRDYAAAFPAAGEPPPWMTYSLPFAAMRRSAWQARPFYVDAWGSEDSHWGSRARAAGEIVRYVPGAAVMHSHNYTLRQLYGRRFIEGEADSFIEGGHASWINLVPRAVASFVNDVPAHLAGRDAGGLLLSPLRRLVFHYAHLRGHRWGEARQLRGDRDASVGQRAVLSRYG